MDQQGLVERARRGDHDAFAVLAGATIARPDAAARLILRNRELARDAVQEAFRIRYRRPRPPGSITRRHACRGRDRNGIRDRTDRSGAPQPDRSHAAASWLDLHREGDRSVDRPGPAHCRCLEPLHREPAEVAAPFGPAINGSLLYDRDDDIYAVDVARAGETTLVAGPTNDFGATYSRDGTRFVFRREVTSGGPVQFMALQSHQGPLPATKPVGGPSSRVVVR